jgi:hypothetical protein
MITPARLRSKKPHAPVRQSREQERADDPVQLLQVVLTDAVVDCVLGEERR